MTKRQGKVLMVILDGWGLNKPYEGNAVYLAKTPVFDKLWASAPHAVLEASGEAVGLPSGQMGTSEVNHLMMGAGKVVFQDLVRINQAIEDESFYTNEAFVSAFEHVKKHNSTLHIKGLLSPGGVHSHQDHVKALLKAAKMYEVKSVYIHVYTDGRDTLPTSALEYIEDLEKYIEEIGVGKIASIAGRYYSMDRAKNWERTDLAFNLLTKGRGRLFKTSREAIKNSYRKGDTDEFILPSRIEVGLGEEGLISSNDAVVFVNFRNDRTRQITERFLEKGPKNLHYVTMTQYHPDYEVKVAFPPVDMGVCLGQLISEAGLKQFRITESDKYAHLTFYLNCKREEPYEGEERLLFATNADIKNHDEKPEMRAKDIAEKVMELMKRGEHQAIFANICNADMVGHSGNIPAVIKALEAVDKLLGRLVKTARKTGYELIITADHGNAEEMRDEGTGEILTAHTANPVPFILVSAKYKELNRDEGGIVDLASTVLTLLGLAVPAEMTGRSLV